MDEALWFEDYADSYSFKVYLKILWFDCAFVYWIEYSALVWKTDSLRTEFF